MKKSFALLCTLVLIISTLLSGCGSKVDYSNSEYLGTWSAASCEYDGIELDVAEIVGTFDLELKADGSCTITTGDESADGKWTEVDDGVIIDDDDEMHFISKDGQLFLDYDGVMIYFSR
ncbi:MAG: hypothetical protein ACOX71_05420 [Lachnospiraceae bacterium]|jgi:hypothetical protein